MNSLLFLVTLVLAGLTGRRVAALVRPECPEITQLAVLGGFVAQIVASGQLCGFILQTFSPWALVATGAVLTASAQLLLPAPVRARATPASIRFRLARAWDTYGWVSAFAGLVAAALLVATAVAFMLPPRGYDSLWYHLPSVAYWLDRGRITTAPFSTYIGRVPANVELLWLHGAAFFGTSRVAVLANAVPTILLGVATRALGRSLGLSARNAALAGVLAVLTPVVLAQTITDHVDAGTTAFVVAASAFAVAACGAIAPRALSSFLRLGGLAGAMAGLAAGAKLSAVIPAAALVAGLVTLALRARWVRGAGAVAVVASVAVLALGSAWYIRNAVADGSPVAPFSLRLAGVEVFHGTERPEDWLSAPPAALAGHVKPLQLLGSWGYDLAIAARPHSVAEEEPRGGLGPVWPLVGLPCLVLAAAWLLRHRQAHDIGPALLAGGYLVAVALLQPYWWWSRFTMPFAVLGAIAVPAVAAHLGRVPRSVLLVGSSVLAFAGGLLGLTEVGYQQNQWSGKFPAAVSLIVDERGFVPYSRVMPTLAVFETLGAGRIGLDDEIDGKRAPTHTDGMFLPLYGASLDRTLIGVEAFPDASSLASWLADQHLLAVVARADGPLAALMRDVPGFAVSPGGPILWTIFVREP